MPRDTSIVGAADLAERPHERLSRMLDRAEISNKALVQALGVVEATVSRWRQGRTQIDDESLQRIVDLLAEKGIRVTMGWMRYGEVAAIAMPDPLQDRKLTAVEEQRAMRTAADRQKPTAKTAKRRKRNGGH